MTEAPAPLTLTAYAKHRGVSKMAVSRAVKVGRLRESVTRDDRGRPQIADPAVADLEWDANTDLSRAPGSVKERAEKRGKASAPPATTKAPPRSVSAPGVEVPAELSLGEESAREKFWKANQAELDYREQCGDLVNATEMAAKLTDVFTRCRTRLLGLPTRAKQQLPHLTVTDIGTIDGIVREALEGLAIELEGEDARG